MEKLLITGVDGVAGSNLALALADRFEILGVSFGPGLAAEGLATARCARGEAKELARLTQQFQPRWIIYAGPLSLSDWDAPSLGALDPEEDRHLAALVACAGELKAALTVLSTDAVFAGPRMFHEEDSPAAATGPLAEHARRVEKRLLSSDALVVRTHVYGWSPLADRPCFVEQLCQALSTGSARRADSARHATPILASDLAPRLARAYELRLQGLYHVTGAERTSPHRLASELAGAFGLNRPAARTAPLFVQGTGHEETSLNCRRARRALDMPMPMLREGLDRWAEQARNGWRERWHVDGRPAAGVRIAA